MGGVNDLAVAAGRCSCRHAGWRTMVVTAVVAGPPKSLSLAEVSGGAAVATGIRYGGAYNVQVPQVGDVVKVATDGNGDWFVVDKIAV